METITAAGKELWDWFESRGTATKDKQPTVQEPDGRSPAIKKGQPKEKVTDNEICECEAKIRAFMRMLRKGEGTQDEGGYSELLEAVHLVVMEKILAIIQKYT
ncbi:hypothetical protein [Chryseobacterium indoltheticum]|uniref:hypothetical protein n=1 Tax=Chryseobacterium indoltheticum TaxID=254 RepID=UPI003F494C6C